MIQRIQTIWLLLASVFISTLFLFPYLNFVNLEGFAGALKVIGEYGIVDGQVTLVKTNVLQLIGTIFLGLMPLYIITQYKNRKKQMALILLQMVLVVIFEVFLYFASNSTLAEHGKTMSTENIGLGFFVLPIALIFLFLAHSAIKKDEKLIRSVDRLR